MKWTDLIIIFVIFTIPFLLLIQIQTNNIESNINKKIELNHILDAAVEDGVSMLVEGGDGHKLLLNKEKCIMSFYNTLFINFNIIDDPYAKSRIMGYLPVIVIIDYDGFYIFGRESYIGKNNNSEIKSVFQPKRMFIYKKENYIYGFTLSNYVTVYDTVLNKFYEGNQIDLKDKINDTVLQDNINFENIRRRTIVNILQEEINLYINLHNDIAKQYGISYQFSLPVIKEEDWYNTVDDIGMLVFFQGMQTGIAGEYYNSYAFGGAKVIKREGYYLQVDAIKDIKYYHKESCKNLIDKTLYYNSRDKAALEGAFPCNECNP